jgi:hypothetical protein
MGLRPFINKTAASLGFTALFGMAAIPSAQALEIRCHEPKEIPALKEAMRKEVQAPVLKFYQEGSERGAKAPKWLESIITMNPETRIGHRLDKKEDGAICVSSNMTDIQLFDYGRTEPDPSAYIRTPDADAAGGINRTLYFFAKRDNLLPILKANEVIPGLRVDAVAYVLGKGDGSGGVLMSSHSGTLMKNFSKAIPSESEGVPHGVIFTDVGKIIAKKADSSQEVLARAP